MNWSVPPLYDPCRMACGSDRGPVPSVGCLTEDEIAVVVSAELEAFRADHFVPLHLAASSLGDAVANRLHSVMGTRQTDLAAWWKEARSRDDASGA